MNDLFALGDCNNVQRKGLISFIILIKIMIKLEKNYVFMHKDIK